MSAAPTRELVAGKEAAYPCAMHLADDKNRTEGEVDAVKARRRGQLLDAAMRNTMPQVVRGVPRGTHEYFNPVDAACQLAAARAFNAQ